MTWFVTCLTLTVTWDLRFGCDLHMCDLFPLPLRVGNRSSRLECPGCLLILVSKWLYVAVYAQTSTATHLLLKLRGSLWSFFCDQLKNLEFWENVHVSGCRPVETWKSNRLFLPLFFWCLSLFGVQDGCTANVVWDDTVMARGNKLSQCWRINSGLWRPVSTSVYWGPAVTGSMAFLLGGIRSTEVLL